MPAFQTPVSAWETFLNAQRWYGSKGTPVESVEPLASKKGEALPLWALLRVELRDSGRDGGERSAAVVQVCSVTDRGGDGELVEDFEAPEFWKFLREAAGGAVNIDGGRFELALDDDVQGFGGEIVSPRVLEGEMSNTLVRAGFGMLLKIYRRVEAGTHPETEALRMLKEQGFENAPRLHGVGRVVTTAGDSSVVMASLEDLGDCENLWDVFTGSSAGDATLESLAGELGSVTANLHKAFERAGGVALHREEPQSLSGELEVLDTLDRAWTELRTDLPTGAGELVDAVLRARSGIEDRLRRAAASELTSIRLHGDYHLGQIVRRKRDGRLMIVDFEGEPALPLKSRRVFAPAARDVAGMLRSFSYARHAAGRSADWERSLRQVFLEAYRADATTAVARGSGSDAEFEDSLLAFELQKALRELRYELGHRPDWISIPLRGIVEMMDSNTD